MKDRSPGSSSDIMSEVKKATKAAYPWRTDERALMDTRMVEFSDPNLSKDARHILLREILTEMKELYDPPLSLLEWKLKKIVSVPPHGY